MSDRLSLSCWLRGFRTAAMLDHYEQLLRLFPYSRLSSKSNCFRVHAVSFSEPVLLETVCRQPFDPEEALQAARQFQSEDCAFQLECAWDLMCFDEEWKLRPMPVSLWCFGPAFENDLGDHLRLELGLESTFLPVTGKAGSIRAAQANLRSLLRLVQEIGRRLPLDSRKLISESGANFAEKLERLVESSAAGSAIH